MFGVDAERYSLDRIENLTRNLAGCLTPETLEGIIRDVQTDPTTVHSPDVLRFVARMTHQLDCLVGSDH